MNNQQKIIVAAIAAITIAAGTAVWVFGGSSSTAASHSEAEGHDDKEHHNEAPAKPEAGKEGNAQAAADDKGKAGGDGHGDHGEEGEEEAVKLTDEQIKLSRIKVEKAQAGTVMSGAEFQGEAKFDGDRTAQVVPRVAGVVELVKADLGQRVKKGDVLAVISSPDLSGQRAALLAARERASAARATYQREKSLWGNKKVFGHSRTTSLLSSNCGRQRSNSATLSSAFPPWVLAPQRQQTA